MIKEYNVATLSGFYEAVWEIGENGSGKIEHCWFRGHGQNDYKLLPTLYRKKYYKCNDKFTYSQMNLREDYRYQHIKARAFHSIKTNPVYKSEWQEIYQHHLGNTRLMDWSESARTALSFALEPYIDTRDRMDLAYKRNYSTPCVWVVNPYKLNEKVYEYMGKKFEPIAGKKLNAYFKDVGGLAILCNEIQQRKNIYFTKNQEDPEIKGIISLCALEDYRRNYGSQLLQSVKSFEFNPFYYMALRMYSDGLPFPVEDITGDILPPIAILHPYHSERIRAQRGVFTMFPNYILNDKVEKFSKRRKIDIREMERQKYIEECLAVIYINDANTVAKELMISGERRSELYPDIETYADIIETKKYYY